MSENIVRDTIADYEYSSYADFKEQWIAAFSKPLTITPNYSLPDGIKFEDLQGINNLETMIADIDPRLLFEKALNYTMSAKTQQMIPSVSSDTDVLQALLGVNTMLSWGCNNQNQLLQLDRQTISSLQKIKSVLRETLTLSGSGLAINPYKLQNTLQKHIGLIMEGAFKLTLNQLDENQILSMFQNSISAELGTSKLLDTPSLRTQRTITRDNKTVFEKKSITEVSSNPLTDVVITIYNSDNTTAKINLSLKTSVNPNAKSVKFYTGSWNSLVAAILADTELTSNPKLFWGLVRQLTYTSMIDPDIQQSIVRQSLPEALASAGSDSAQLLYYNGKIFQMASLIQTLEKNMTNVTINGALRGNGQSFTDRDRARFKGLKANYPNLSLNHIRDKAAVTWSDKVNSGLGVVSLKFKSTIFDNL